MLGLKDMEAKLANHKWSVKLEAARDLGTFTRRLGRIQTEPEMSIPFWLLKPKGRGPFPVGIFVHGHSRGVGMDEYVGIAADAEIEQHIKEFELDVGPRAARKGLIAIVPAVRGFKPVDIADLIGFYNKKPCRAHLAHCLMVGRTAFGERIWDIERLIDYALTLPEVDGDRVLLMGHSGGGGLTTFAAAVEPRISIAVSSGWYNTIVNENGALNHCECNTVPGLLQFGEVWDVAGLIAPRPFLVVSGTNDLARKAYDPNVVKAVAELRRIYSVAGAEGQFEQAVGVGGHKYFNDLQWPWVLERIGEKHGN
jgi:dienelactone hydrolase